MLPKLDGRPIRVVIRKSLGPHLAATSIPGRVVNLDRDVLIDHGDFERILVHELFHFVWVRLSNQTRWDWERLLANEIRRRVKGELGWSAEWRKDKLTAIDIRQRKPKWRHYACESLCDTAAWAYSGLSAHGEFTLDAAARRKRKAWLVKNVGTGPVPV
ncbi:MAG: hypothetical protein ABI811_23270 [Acidobacteriota bacterium]